MTQSKYGKRYSEEQILRILCEVESGIAVQDIRWKYGVSENIVYRWRSKFGEMNAEQLRQMKQLEAENARILTSFSPLRNQKKSHLRHGDRLQDEHRYGVGSV